MAQSCPRIRHIQKKSICIHFHSLHCESVIDHITPCGGDIVKSQIKEKLLRNLSPLLIELESEKMSVVLYRLRECAG